jgi:short-subunit dehydrogenase
MAARFSGRTALVTGASSGIGAELARQLAAEGANLVLVARRTDRLQELATELTGQGARVCVLRGDVTREGDMEAAVAAAVQQFGQLDLLVANAGFGVAGRFESLSLDDYRRQFETNVYGVLRTVRAGVAELRRVRGQLVVMGSVAGHVALAGASPYAMSKFAIRAFTDAIDGELRPQGVRVTLVSPGFVSSEIRRVNNQGVLREQAADPIPAWLRVPTDKAVRSMLDGIARGRREVVVTGHGKAAVMIKRLAPWLITWLAARGMKGRKEPG